MDTTEQNIKMLSKAWEIQEKWQHQEGDFYFCPGKHSRGVVRILVNVSHMPKDAKTASFNTFKNYIWLPRQDDLQAMLEEKDIFALLDLLHEEVNEYEYIPSVSGLGSEIDAWKPKKYYEQFTSWEQLWLALVMKLLYTKSWNGEDWIKEETLGFSPGFAEV